MNKTTAIRLINKLIKGITAKATFEQSGDSNEIRINFTNGNEATAYYTDDAQDAVNTAKAMSATL